MKKPLRLSLKTVSVKYKITFKKIVEMFVRLWRELTELRQLLFVLFRGVHSSSVSQKRYSVT